MISTMLDVGSNIFTLLQLSFYLSSGLIKTKWKDIIDHTFFLFLSHNHMKEIRKKNEGGILDFIYEKNGIINCITVEHDTFISISYRWVIAIIGSITYTIYSSSHYGECFNASFIFAWYHMVLIIVVKLAPKIK